MHLIQKQSTNLNKTLQKTGEEERAEKVQTTVRSDLQQKGISKCKREGNTSCIIWVGDGDIKKTGAWRRLVLVRGLGISI